MDRSQCFYSPMCSQIHVARHIAHSRLWLFRAIIHVRFCIWCARVCWWPLLASIVASRIRFYLLFMLCANLCECVSLSIQFNSIGIVQKCCRVEKIIFQLVRWSPYDAATSGYASHGHCNQNRTRNANEWQRSQQNKAAIEHNKWQHWIYSQPHESSTFVRIQIHHAKAKSSE